MKLITKTILNYLIICVPLLVIVGAASYFIIKSELQDGIDENLEREKRNIQKLIETAKTPEKISLSYDSLSFIKVVPKKYSSVDEYKDTSIYSKKKLNFKNYRVLRSFYDFNNTHYQITIVRTVSEEEELMTELFSAFLIVTCFLVFSFFGVSSLLSRKLWSPFYRTLEILRNYNLKSHKQTHFPMEYIREFRELNVELSRMTQKIHHDFLQQKEFTENASHEMQTPLAVIRANLSLLMQSPQLGETEMNQLQSIENTIKKLGSLNKALILLSKIENNQYPENVKILLKDKIESALETYEAFAQAKNISVYKVFESDPILTMNPALFDLLIGNLLQNAIRHNYDKGAIHISLQKSELRISNTGEPLTIPESEIFNRFKKNDASKDSIGLGLAIVKSIVQLYKMDIKYVYVSKSHVFIFKFAETQD